MSIKVSKIFRILLLAPVIGGIMITTIMILKPYIFVSVLQFVLSLVCIVVLPMLAYPISYIVPGIREKGRDGQRELAIVFSFVGYVLGFAFCFLFESSPEQKAMFLTYVLSATLLGLFSFVFKIKASGHACGVSGPVAYSTVFISPWCAFFFLALIFVYMSSIKLKRHTLPQLIIGTIIPIVALILSIAIFIPLANVT